MIVERGSYVLLPTGRKGFVTKHLGEYVVVRYIDGDDEVTLRPQLLTLLTPYKEKA